MLLHIKYIWFQTKRFFAFAHIDHRLEKKIFKKSSEIMNSTSYVTGLGSLSLLLAHLSTLCSK